MEVIATGRYLRISPKKVKGLVQNVVGKKPIQVTHELLLVGNKAARILAKVIRSSVSNAKNNAKLNEDQLSIKTVEVGKGPFFKRWTPVSRGMAHQIKKRTAHIKVILWDKK